MVQNPVHSYHLGWFKGLHAHLPNVPVYFSPYLKLGRGKGTTNVSSAHQSRQIGAPPAAVLAATGGSGVLKTVCHGILIDGVLVKHETHHVKYALASCPNKACQGVSTSSSTAAFLSLPSQIKTRYKIGCWLCFVYDVYSAVKDSIQHPPAASAIRIRLSKNKHACKRQHQRPHTSQTKAVKRRLSTFHLSQLLDHNLWELTRRQLCLIKLRP